MLLSFLCAFRAVGRGSSIWLVPRQPVAVRLLNAENVWHGGGYSAEVFVIAKKGTMRRIEWKTLAALFFDLHIAGFNYFSLCSTLLYGPAHKSQKCRRLLMPRALFIPRKWKTAWNQKEKITSKKNINSVLEIKKKKLRAKNIMILCHHSARNYRNQICHKHLKLVLMQSNANNN